MSGGGASIPVSYVDWFGSVGNSRISDRWWACLCEGQGVRFASMWDRGMRLIGAVLVVGAVGGTVSSAPAFGAHVRAAAAESCPGPKHSVCVRFDGTATGHETSPSLFATSRHDTVRWNLEWNSTISGYGVPNHLTKSSDAAGNGSVTYQSPNPACNTGFDLSSSNPPTLAQGRPFNSRTVLKIEIPDPVEASSGTGTGGPAIVARNVSCPALIGGLPGNFFVKVNLNPRIREHTYRVSGGGPYSQPGKSGTSTLTGTLTVVIH